jgi:Ca-activated chloride channel homolog
MQHQTLEERNQRGSKRGDGSGVRSAPRRTIAALLCLALLACLGHAAAAFAGEDDEVSSGTLFFKGSDGTGGEAARLHTDVSIAVSGIIARVDVRQRFTNPSSQWVEGIYAFPLPENSAVDQLRMEIGSRVIVGEIHEKVAAQQLYEQARANGQHASVVHQSRPNLFRTAVANIGPNESVTIVISYLQIVEQNEGRYSLRFPLTITPRYMPGMASDSELPLTSETPAPSVSNATSPDDAATLGDLFPRLVSAARSAQSASIDVDLDAGAALSNVFSTYHAINTDLRDSGAHVTLRGETIAPDHDFELGWTPIVHGEPIAAVFREHTEAGEHVLLMFMPPHEGQPLTTPREAILIIDTSGSMAGQSIEQARAALLKALADLQPRDRFTVIEFNSTMHLLFNEPVPASPVNLARARQFVWGLQANGGTEMYQALSAAFSMKSDGEYLRQIVFITDGAVGNEDQLMTLIKQQLGAARLFTVGIGSAPNGYFMRKAAQMGRGTFTYIGAPNEVDARMSELLGKLTHPVLTDIALYWPQGVAAEYAPAQISDLYAGEPVVISARVPDASKGVVTVTGHGHGVWSRQISLASAPVRKGVATLWARNRIADFSDARASGASDDQIRAQVLPIALKYGLVSNYTSLVAVDKTPARPEGEPLDSSRLANTKPQGLDWAVDSYPKTATPAELEIYLGLAALLLAAMLITYERRWRRRPA